MLVYLYGTGLRQRRLTSVLLSAAGLDVQAFDSRDEAVAALQDVAPQAFLDARVAPDRSFFEALERGAPAIGLARNFRGDVDPTPCALIASSGEDLQALANGRDAETFVAGRWTAQPKPAVRGDSRHAVRVHALSWEGVGYANGARELMLGLDALGVRVDYRMDWRNGPADQLYADDRIALMRMLGTTVDQGSPAIVYHPPTHVGGGPILDVYRESFVRGPLIGYTMFETDALPMRWRAPLAACERVWVPSEFNRQTFAESGVPQEKIDVVPIGIDIARYEVDGPRLPIADARGFVFLAIGQWRLRKGWDVLLAAYARAFGPDEPVTLVIRAGLEGIDVANDLSALCRNLGLTTLPHIVLLPNALSRDDLQSLYRAADAFVLTTRGEAFGIPLLEAMALGIPCIGPGFGGSLDFLDSTSGFLIDSRLVEVSDAYARPLPFYRLQRWAEPAVESAARAMRAVYEHRDDALLRAARGAVRVRTGFNRDAVAVRALEALDRVPPRRRTVRVSPRVRFDAPVYSFESAGRECRALLAAAASAGIRAAVVPSPGDEAAAALRTDDLRTIKAALVPGEGAVAAIAFRPGVPQDVPRAILRVAPASMTATARFVAGCAGFVEVWVPSVSAADALERGGVPPAKLRIVRIGVDVDFWTPDAALPRAADDGIFRFLAAVDWTLSDGWDVLLAAYVDAFRGADPVTLTIKTTDFTARRSGRTAQPADEIRAFLSQRYPDRAARGDIPPIALNMGLAGSEDVVKLFNANDAFVSAGRIRPWGFAEAAAMACGLPAIAPRFGSHMAFMHDENGYLYDVGAIVPAAAESAEFAGDTWVEPNCDALAAAMRRVVLRREEARLRGRRAREDIVRLHSLDALGRALRDELARLSVDAAVPPRQAQDGAPILTVIVEPNGDPAALERCLVRLRRNTTETAAFVVAGPEPVEVPTAYTAVVGAGAVVGPGWDRILLNALATQPGATLAMAHCVELPPGMPPLPVLDYDGAAIDRCDLEARETAFSARSTGAFAGQLDLRCVLGSTAALRTALAAGSLSGERAWTAFDCRVFVTAVN